MRMLVFFQCPIADHTSLNLTAASQVHIIEPHWNPMIEEQAASRVYRLGQQREVTINRYIVKDSVEEVCIIFCFSSKSTNS
jgi:SNF2 family DNA or RNA helicase